jgi:hypothetical protein
MFARWLRLATAALALLAGIAIAFEMSEDQFADELAMGWKLGLRARQSSENLQFFTGNVGGASAPGVRTPQPNGSPLDRRLTRHSFADHKVEQPR